MSNLLTESGCALILADIKREMKNTPEGNFEMVIKWDNTTNVAVLYRLIPDPNDCRASATKWKTVREVEYNPILEFIKEVADKVILLDSKIEVNSEWEDNFINFYFPEN